MLCHECGGEVASPYREANRAYCPECWENLQRRLSHISQHDEYLSRRDRRDRPQKEKRKRPGKIVLWGLDGGDVHDHRS